MAAIQTKQFEAELVFGRARQDVDVAAIAGLAKIGRIAGAAIDDDLVIGAVGEIGGRMVRRVVRIAERDTIDRHVVFAVAKPAQDQLGIAKAGTIAQVGRRGARGQRGNRHEIGGLGNRILDDRARDDRLRFGRMHRCRDRRFLVHPRRADYDLIAVADRLICCRGRRRFGSKRGHCGAQAQGHCSTGKSGVANLDFRHGSPQMGRGRDRRLTGPCYSYE